MFASLSGRVAGLGLLVVVALGSLAGLLVDASYRTRDSLHWVIHSAELIETTEEALGALRDAESGQRGFILTHNPVFASDVAEEMDKASSSMARVLELTRDNPPQHVRARQIATLMAQRSHILRHPIELARKGDFGGATQVVASGRGRELMNVVAARMRMFLDEERVLQAERGEAVAQRLDRGKWLALAGGSLVAIMVLASVALLIRGIRGPLDTMMQAMTNLGGGARQVRIDTAMGSREFSRLAAGYNAMADQLEAAVTDQATVEQQLQVANAELRHNTGRLRERSMVIERLGGMAHRMQAARTDAELAQIIRVFVPRVLPDIPGGLYAHNNSRNLLVPVASWGGLEIGGEGFAPDQCWALRRGQSHSVQAPGEDIICGHVTADEAYHCEPLLAGGEVIGVLHLKGHVDVENRFRLTVLAENIASALVNHRLQRSLREQTIRDPLTGLFNRRYMEETLALEMARASRSDAPLSLVMCDVDHFKRFNDEFGHDAGDAVLKAVAAAMKRNLRDGDVVCRFGGEEFAIISPGTSVEAMMERVERVRQVIADLNVRQNGRTLGSTSMSFGIAAWTKGMARDGATLVQNADTALYEAKHEGRNRAIISRLAA